MRYRLRFVLQELDLPPGGTIIGRSLDCHLTLEDPLVSRRHARITVDAAGARIEDMGSRNGVRVNGAIIREPIALRNGDRVRIGTQDFLFSCVDPGARAHSRTTGQLRLCANCRLPYPRELLACPSCEATEQTDEDTLTGSDGATHAWNLQLLVESLERALRLARLEDAKRILERAVAQVEEVIGTGVPLDPTVFGGLAAQAIAMSVTSGDLAWARWVLGVYGRTREIPPVAVIRRLAEVAAQDRIHVRDLVDALLRRLDPAWAERTSETTGAESAVLSGVADIGDANLGPPADIFSLVSSIDGADPISSLRLLRQALSTDEDAPSPVLSPAGPRHLPTA